MQQFCMVLWLTTCLFVEMEASLKIRNRFYSENDQAQQPRLLTHEDLKQNKPILHIKSIHNNTPHLLKIAEAKIFEHKKKVLVENPYWQAGNINETQDYELEIFERLEVVQVDKEQHWIIPPHTPRIVESSSRPTNKDICFIVQAFGQDSAKVMKDSVLSITQPERSNQYLLRKRVKRVIDFAILLDSLGNKIEFPSYGLEQVGTNTFSIDLQFNVNQNGDPFDLKYEVSGK